MNFEFRAGDVVVCIGGQDKFIILNSDELLKVYNVRRVGSPVDFKCPYLEAERTCVRVGKWDFKLWKEVKERG